MHALYAFLPTVALIAVLFTLGIPALTGRFWPKLWIAPALLSAAFLGWSLFTVWSEGLGAVWAEHTRNAWGNQIWFDLLIAIGLGWLTLAPRARALGMRPAVWLLAVLCTGCVGLLAMLARCQFLEARALKA